MSKETHYLNEQGDIKGAVVVREIAATVVVITAAIMGGCPQYNVWQQKLKGEAELSRASMNRQIAVQEAEAKHAAASELAKAEVERAKGVAAANKIIGDSLKDNEGYLRYLWIDSLHQTQNQIIYVPTEANLPLLEAGRLKK